jgi:hypothetical protein
MDASPTLIEHTEHPNADARGSVGSWLKASPMNWPKKILGSIRGALSRFASIIFFVKSNRLESVLIGCLRITPAGRTRRTMPPER